MSEPEERPENRPENGSVKVLGIERIDLGEVPYTRAGEEMMGWVERRRAGEIPDRLVLLTHPPVITYGSRTPPQEGPS